MRAQKIELEVDFIGGQGSLTIEEEKALSIFFKQQKKSPLKSAGGSKKPHLENRPSTNA